MEIDTVACGDCLDVLATIPDESVDAVVTDPPCGINLSAEVCAWDIWPDPKVWGELYRVVNDSGFFVLSIAPHVAHERIPDILVAGWNVVEVGFWVYGSGRPVNSQRLKRCYDLVYFLSKRNRALLIEEARGAFKAGTPTGRKGVVSGSSALGRQFGKCTSSRHYTFDKDYHPANVACEIDSGAFGNNGYDMIFAVKRLLPTGKKDRNHPTQKPTDLIAQQIKLTTEPGDLVLDPFIGSGTTAVAALRLGRHFYGCDSDPEYVAIANNRIERVRNEMVQMELSL